jgi:hypothetical protein
MGLQHDDGQDTDGDQEKAGYRQQPIPPQAMAGLFRAWFGALLYRFLFHC